MNPHRSPFRLVILFVLVAATVGGIIWTSHRLASQAGIGGRFWIEYIAVRAKVVDGISPYSATVSNRIHEQVGDLFRWAPGPALSYNAPLISAIITLPFALVADANLAHTAWLVLQFVVILLTILAGMQISGWKPAWWFLLILLPLILLSLQTAVSWYEGSMVIWVSGLVAWVVLAIRGKRFDLAGVLLALTMIMPQIVILFVVFVLIWAGSQRKWSLIFWFFSIFLILGALAMFLVQDWPLQYLRILWNFSQYFPPGSPGYAFQQLWPGLGRQMGWILSAILGLILLIEWWLARRSNFRGFFWTACLTLAASPLIGIPVGLDAHLLLGLPLILVLALFEERWKRNGKWVVLAGLMGVFAWEWYLTLASLGDVASNPRLGLIFSLPLMVLLGLFWVRWWAIYPKRLLVDELRDSESY